MIRLPYERRLQLLALAGMIGPLVMAALLLALRPNLGGPWVALGAGLAVLGILLSFRLAREAQRPLQTLANLLAALREGDYSFRGRGVSPHETLGTVFMELNTLSELLRTQRVKALEATALLQAVMAEIEIAILVFDDAGRVRLVNPAAERMIGRPSASLMGKAAAELGLADTLEGESHRLLDLLLPGRAGRFELHRSIIRQGGRPHHLLVLSDLTRPLREEERVAWQRLIRVLGHEINNSLAPIQSLAGSIDTLIHRQAPDWKEDAKQGLSIIAGRSQSLARFMDSLTRLARLPAPKLAMVDAALMVRKVAALETRLRIEVEEGPPLAILGDLDQLEQALINLARNAVEAVSEDGGRVRIGWGSVPRWSEIWVDDEGPGLPSSGNLFVPFFTTKPGGNGIGLLLARQIIEAHGGALHLENRVPKGVRALLRLPAPGSS